MAGIQILTLVFLLAAAYTENIQVATVCVKGEKVKLEKGLSMKCKDDNTWEAEIKRNSRKKNPGAPPCEDSASADQCQADRGHCNQFTEAGQELERTCPGTCESCDGCRCQDSSQWHQYCPYWSQYCDDSGVLGTWMTTNCRKSCNKCKCNCCSYKGKSHKLGEKILLPDKCGELVCEESLVAPPSPLLAGAVQHNVSHPEEVTLVFRSLHTGADCCVLDNGTMVAEGWNGKVVHNGSSLQGICCHGVLSTPIQDIIFDEDIVREDIQCTRSYTTLNETWRRIVPGVPQPAGSQSQCDTFSRNGFEEGWYRFSFPEAPFAKIPTSPPLVENRQADMKSCKTHAVSWVDASYPSVGEQPKNVTIKFAYQSKENWSKSSEAKIVACNNGVYLYHLKQVPGCSFAYCAM